MSLTLHWLSQNQNLKYVVVKHFNFTFSLFAAKPLLRRTIYSHKKWNLPYTITITYKKKELPLWQINKWGTEETKIKFIWLTRFSLTKHVTNVTVTCISLIIQSTPLHPKKSPCVIVFPRSSKLNPTVSIRKPYTALMYIITDSMMYIFSIVKFGNVRTYNISSCDNPWKVLMLILLIWLLPMYLNEYNK